MSDYREFLFAALVLAVLAHVTDGILSGACGVTAMTFWGLFFVLTCRSENAEARRG